MKLTYSIYYPSGNATALVNKLILKPNLKKLINNKIVALNPQVEQVGFIDEKNYRLEMAGGEFCGNATRCAVFYYLKGKPGKIKIKVSGVKQKLSAGIDNNNKVWAEIPVNSISKKYGYVVVSLEGITQVITFIKGNKQKAKSILAKLNLLTTVPASGVMFIKKEKNRIKLNPFVWVRDIKTFFNETACASGTAAVGIYFAKKLKRSLNLPVIQPSGETIIALVRFPLRVSINGQVKIIKKNLTIVI